MSPEEEEDRVPLDDLLDLFVYAPIGLAVTAVEELPKMVDRGREVLGKRVGTARVLGRVAVNQGRVELSRIVSQWNDLGALLRSGAMSPTGTAERRDDPDSTGEGSGPAPVHDAAAGSPGKRPPAGRREKAQPRPAHAPAAPPTLGIPGYESLSASQVVSRLAGLSPLQRQAVKDYESATRRRSTILGRIAQLEAGTAN